MSIEQRTAGPIPDPRVLVFIVAYNAETTISAVLSRIPRASLPKRTDILIIDDASSDDTVGTACRCRDETDMDVTILNNPVNQGYGGNQKLGYQYAIAHGYDVVVLLHGDGQYAPEKLPDVIAPLIAGQADASFGSRMMEPGAARDGGMPLYKYVGNRILTMFQNHMLGTALSEFHSGYRAYAVRALERVPFHYNTRDFHFDTEIIVQFVLTGLRIREVPIPTYYGDEICYVNGLGYAWNVFRSMLACRLHQMGIFYQRQYHVEAPSTQYVYKGDFCSSHTMAVKRVAAGSRVLDLACGPGYVAEVLQSRGCRVTGVDAVEQSAERFERFIQHDLNGPTLPVAARDFDTVLALDCIEHLNTPEQLVAEIRRTAQPEVTRFVVTAPNIGFFVNRGALLFGQFNYGARGILDLEHKRLFTFRTLRALLEQEGFRVEWMRGIPAPFPLAFKGVLGRVLLQINRVLVRVCPSLFSYQIYAEAVPLPTVDHLLAQTARHSE